jgi:hypothetical protein
MSVLLRRATGAIGRPSVWLGMVLVLDAAIAVTGIFVARGSGLLSLLAAGPLLACARCSGRATALVQRAIPRPLPAEFGPRIARRGKRRNDISAGEAFNGRVGWAAGGIDIVGRSEDTFVCGR